MPNGVEHTQFLEIRAPKPSRAATQGTLEEAFDCGALASTRAKVFRHAV